MGKEGFLGLDMSGTASVLRHRIQQNGAFGHGGEDRNKLVEYGNKNYRFLLEALQDQGFLPRKATGMARVFFSSGSKSGPITSPRPDVLPRTPPNWRAPM